MKKNRIILISVLAGFFLLASGTIIGGAKYAVNFALSPIEKDKVTFTESDSWLVKESRIVESKSFDGLNLKAYFATPAKNSHRYGIFMHGYRDNPVRMADYALHFYEKGWNVLLPGQRGHGWSDGDYIDMGIYACKDVVKWINFIISQDKDAQIMLYGVSMGAATVMNATGQTLPLNVKCAVEDCGYSSTWDQFKYRMLSDIHLPSFPILNLAERIAKKRYGFNFRDVAPKNEIHNSNTPMLFIHGTADTYVPFQMQDIVFTAAICEKEKLVVPGAVHSKSVYTEPELYWTSVDRFVGKYIK